MSDEHPESAGVVFDLDRLIGEARRLAAEYRRATGKPLPGVSAEIALHDAAALLGLELTPGARGHDALGRGGWAGKRLQIKGRTIFDERKGGQRLGQLKMGEAWDSLLLVLMDEDYQAFEIWEAARADIEAALVGRGEPARRRRGAVSVAQFKIIGRLVWDRVGGVAQALADPADES